jgi:hypothetical protein
MCRHGPEQPGELLLLAPPQGHGRRVVVQPGALGRGAAEAEHQAVLAARVAGIGVARAGDVADRTISHIYVFSL